MNWVCAKRANKQTNKNPKDFQGREKTIFFRDKSHKMWMKRSACKLPSLDSHDSNVKAKYSTMQISVVSHTIVYLQSRCLFLSIFGVWITRHWERENEKKAHREKECMCVCVCVFVCICEKERKRQCFLNISRHYQPFCMGKNHLFLFIYCRKVHKFKNTMDNVFLKDEHRIFRINVR